MEQDNMRVLAFAAQKGGAGKTTLAANVAVQAERSGAGPVAMIDTDPQGSLTHWHRQREEKTPAFVQAPIARLGEHVAEMRDRGIKLLIIDTPPAITSTIGHVMQAADLVVIPTRPSPHDLRAAGATVDIAERLGKPIVFVINGAHPTAKITTEAAIALSQHGPLASAVIHQRTNFAASMIDGRTVLEVPGRSRSPEEVAELWSYLKRLLFRDAAHGISRPGAAAPEEASLLKVAGA